VRVTMGLVNRRGPSTKKALKDGAPHSSCLRWPHRIEKVRHDSGTYIPAQSHIDKRPNLVRPAHLTPRLQIKAATRRLLNAPVMH
jgi:hypothetical protein